MEAGLGEARHWGLGWGSQVVGARLGEAKWWGAGLGEARWWGLGWENQAVGAGMGGARKWGAGPSAPFPTRKLSSLVL